MLALAAFAGQGNADTTEWTRVSGSEIIMDGEFWNTGQWTNGTPDATKDVVMNDSAMPNVKLCGKDSVLEMRSLTIREKDSMVWWTTSQEQDNMIVGGAFDSSSYAGPTLKVGEGGIRYDNATDGAAVIFGTAQIGISGDRYGYGFKNISVEGDIVFNNLGAIKMCYDPNEKYGTGNWSLDVGGVVRMNGSVENQRFILNSSFLLDTFTVAYIRLGGLDGSGVMRNSDGGASESNLYFQAQDGKAFQGGRWSGFIGKYNMGDTPVGINLVMDGGEGGGKQYLRLTSPDNEENLALDKLTLTVKSGHIGVSNPGERFDSVTLEGGTLEIDLKSDYDPNLNYMDVFYADSLEIKGESRILLSAAPNSEITAFDVLNVFGDGRVELVIDLLPEFFSVGDSLEENYVIFSGIESNTYDWSKAVLRVMYNGEEQSLDKISLINNGGSVSVELAGTVVPEPSTIAAIFGVLSLAFAAYRGRK